VWARTEASASARLQIRTGCGCHPRRGGRKSKVASWWRRWGASAGHRRNEIGLLTGRRRPRSGCKGAHGGLQEVGSGCASDGGQRRGRGLLSTWGTATFTTSVFLAKEEFREEIVIAARDTGFKPGVDVRHLWMRQTQILGSQLRQRRQSSAPTPWMHEALLSAVLDRPFPSRQRTDHDARADGEERAQGQDGVAVQAAYARGGPKADDGLGTEARRRGPGATGEDDHRESPHR